MELSEEIEMVLRVVAKQGLKGTNKEIINKRVIIQAREKLLYLFKDYKKK